MFLVAAVQITKLGDQLLAADSTAGKAVFPISHLEQQYVLSVLNIWPIGYYIENKPTKYKEVHGRQFPG